MIASMLHNRLLVAVADYLALSFTRIEGLETVKRKLDFKSRGSKKIKTTDIKIEGIPYVKFEVI